MTTIIAMLSTLGPSRWIKGLARATTFAVTAIVFATQAQAQAQAFPSKPIRIIVPYAAGGLLDAMMRRMSPLIAESVGQQVIVDNRPGGLTNIGMQACASAPADGHTVCFTLDDSTVYNPLLYRRLPYDANAMVPVINLVRGQTMLVAHAKAPFDNLKEMVAYAKTRPGAINWGTFGPASTPDLYRHWLARVVGADIVGIPYRGAAGTLPAVVSGETHVTVLPIGMVMPQIRGGQLKPIAVVGDKRWPELPNVAALGEEGLDPGLRSVWGVYAPPGTPMAAVDRLNAEFAKALAHPGVRELMQTGTLEPVGGSAAEFARTMIEVRANAQRLFQAMDVKPVDMPN